MEKISFTTLINAPKEKVWETLWSDATYREWTKAFCEGSYAVGDFNIGNKILFLDPQNNGMVSRVADMRENEFMSIEHLGEVKEGVEDTTSEKVKSWAGVKENYTLTESNGATEVRIDMDATGEFKDWLMNTWPSALERLKKIAETI